MHPPGFIRGGRIGDSLRGFRFRPNASNRHPWIARRHPGAGQKNSLLDQMELVDHGSSSCSPSPRVAPDAQRRNPATDWKIRLLVREGESGFLYQRLTRSIHMSRVVKSGVEIVGSWARGGLLSALITTQERTPNTRRFLCGLDTHSSPAKKGNFPATGLDHTPIGYCQANLLICTTKVAIWPSSTKALFLRALFRKSR